MKIAETVNQEYYDEMVERYGGIFARNLSAETIVPVLADMLKTNELATLTGASSATASRYKKNPAISADNAICQRLYSFYCEASERAIVGTSEEDYIPMYTAQEVSMTMKEMSAYYESMISGLTELKRKATTRFRAVRDNAPKDEKAMNEGLEGFADRTRKMARAKKTQKASYNEEKTSTITNGKPKAPISQAFETSRKNDVVQQEKPAVECEKTAYHTKPDCLVKTYTDGKNYAEYPVGRWYADEQEWKTACGFSNPKYDDFYNALSIKERYVMELVHLFKYSRLRKSDRASERSNDTDYYREQRRNLLKDIPTFWYVFKRWGGEMLDVLRTGVFGTDGRYAYADVDSYVPSEYRPQDKPPFETLEEFRAWYAECLEWASTHTYNSCNDVGTRDLSDEGYAERPIIDEFNKTFTEDYNRSYCNLQANVDNYRFGKKIEYVVHDGIVISKAEYEHKQARETYAKKLEEEYPVKSVSLSELSKEGGNVAQKYNEIAKKNNQNKQLRIEKLKEWDEKHVLVKA